ncbi:ATP-binding protein [Pseudoalteromonas sp. MMG022]|uniref:ATP-binding protein n=1 Tax=Pseudoalteromonas sp. MMG022 TaxID=2909978 RepID=UPI001F1AF216|nr:ATP-binding protein [Pseudoalteromonas sp. MMG022]MCF6434253.1 ATP-binding protein [Pseudoalteromonas sp. MMG022]
MLKKIKKLLCFIALFSCFLTLDHLLGLYDEAKLAHITHTQVAFSSEQQLLVGQLVFSLQRERGTSLIFYAQKDLNRFEVLNQYKKDTDQRLTQATHYFSEQKVTTHLQGPITALNSAPKMLAKLRAQALNKEITERELFQRYTKLIDSLLSTQLTILQSGISATKDTKSSDFSGYLNLLYSIEYAGKLRANVGRYLHAPHQKSATKIANILYLHANHNHLLQTVSANEKLRNAILALLNTTEKGLIDGIIERFQTTGNAKLEISNWWLVSTDYINQLIELSDSIAQQHAHSATQNKASSQHRLVLLTFAIATLALLITVILYKAWGFMMSHKDGQNLPLNYWQLALIFVTFILVILVTHRFSQRILNDDLNTQLAGELRSNAIHTLQSAKEVWYKPVKIRLTEAQAYLSKVSDNELNNNTTLQTYMSANSLAIYDLSKQAWLINGSDSLDVAKQQAESKLQLAKQGKIVSTTVFLNDTLSAHFATTAVSQNGTRPYLIWYSQSDFTSLKTLLKSPFLSSDSTTFYFDKHHIVTSFHEYENLWFEKNIYNTHTSLTQLGTQMLQPYDNFLGKSVLGVFAWDNELGIGIGSERKISAINSLVDNVQNEFTIQLVMLLLLSSGALFAAFRVQNRAIEKLSQSEQQLEKDKIQLNMAQQIANMGSWEWQHGQRDVLISNELANMLNPSIDVQTCSLRSLLRFLTAHSRKALFLELKKHHELQPIKMQLTTQNLIDITHIELAANWQVVHSPQENRRSHTTKTLVGIVKNVTRMVKEQNHQQRQQVALRAAREAALKKMDEAELQRKALESSLAENKKTEKLLQETIDSIPAFILLLDSKANIKLVNQYGFKSQHTDQFRAGLFLNTLFRVGDSCLDAINSLPLKQKRPLLDAVNAAQYQDNYVKELECEYNVDGTTLWYEVIITTLETDNDKAILLYQHDITQRKKNSTLLEEAKAKAELASDAKSRFLATMSHEIRTPMNGVVGMLDLLHQSPLSQEQNHLTSVAKNSALMLLRIINDILDFSKIEAGKMAIDKVAFNWRTLVKEIAELLSHQVKEKNLQLYFMFDPELSYWQLGDPIRIRQILLNLIGNAIKFTKTTSSKIGVIEIQVGSISDKQNQLQISVKDNGKGMTGEQQTRLFQPFTQADSTIHQQFGGTGLGLSITQKLVAMMQGHIKCQSQENVGSTFSVELPYQSHEVNQSASEIEIRFNNTKVYILGDDDVFEQDLRANLIAHGAECQIDNWVNVNNSKINSLDVNYIIVTLERYQQIVTSDYQFQPNHDNTVYIILVGDNFTIPLPKESCFEPIFYNPYYSFKIIEQLAVREGIISPEVKLEPVATLNQLELPSIEQAQFNNQLILIIEDNAYNQEVFRRQLSLLGYQCMIAEHGAMALEFLQSYSFALIITDCHMPVMDGYTFTKEFRQLEKQNQLTKETPIIAATANALSGERNKCLEAGMSDYISKPIELTKLKLIIHKWMPCVASSTEPEHIINHHDDTQHNKLIDFGQLSEFVGDDKSTQHLFLKSFMSDSSPLMKLLVEQQSDISQVQSFAHQLKSSAKAVGAAKLAESYHKLEAAAKDKSQDRIDSLFPQCISQFDAVCSEITSILNSSD